MDRVIAAAVAAALVLSTIGSAGQARAAVAPSVSPACAPASPAPNDPLGATGAVTPILELPGGSTQPAPRTAQAVLGVQTTPARRISGLPSTTTEDGPSFPLAALGLAITALGGALLRRRDTPG